MDSLIHTHKKGCERSLGPTDNSGISAATAPALLLFLQALAALGDVEEVGLEARLGPAGFGGRGRRVGLRLRLGLFVLRRNVLLRMVAHGGASPFFVLL